MTDSPPSPPPDPVPESPGMPREVSKAFHRAFAAGDVTAVRELLRRSPEARSYIDAPLFPFDSPALVHFAGKGHLGIVELLLELGADPNRRSGWWAGGFHPLHVARGETADRLLEAGAVPDACAAANLDRPDLLRDLLDTDPDRVDERGGDGQTPLHFARSRRVADLLLDRGADIDARDVDHRSTPAQWMLERRRGAGRYELALYLVERGASVDVFLAAALGLTDELRTRLEADPSLLDLRTGRGPYGPRPPGSYHIYFWTIGANLSPLQVADRFERDDARDVLDAFAAPRHRFVAACADARADEARRIAERHPGLMDELTPADRRALPDAAWASDADAVELMMELGFDPAAPGPEDGTALHCAAWQGSADSVEAVLRHPRGRALVEARDPVHGSTPLGWCCHGARHRRNPDGDYPEVARLLLGAGAAPAEHVDDAPEAVRSVIRSYRR